MLLRVVSLGVALEEELVVVVVVDEVDDDDDDAEVWVGVTLGAEFGRFSTLADEGALITDEGLSLPGR